MRVLDLFAGLKGWSEAFEERGHEVFSVDLDERFDVSLHKDILQLTPDDLPWKPDIILASPPCEAFSVMTIGKNWTKEGEPKTQKAILALELVWKTRDLIAQLNPKFFVIENPRGKLRKLEPIQGLNRATITYCQYGRNYMKPTDLWGGFPPSWEPRAMCKPGASCHMSSPRGSKNGSQGGRDIGPRSAGVSDVRTKENPWLRKDGKYGPRYSSFGVEGSVAYEQVLYWSTDPRRAEHSARVAKIPYELSLEICEAAERDL